jgi:head-tail adaptor
MSFRSLLNQTVTIKRASYATGADGRQARTWAVLYRRVKCRFEALHSKETVIAYDKATTFANYFVHLEYLSGIKEGDRLYMDNGRTFDVKLVMNFDEANDIMKLAVMEVDRNA